MIVEENGENKSEQEYNEEFEKLASSEDPNATPEKSETKEDPKPETEAKPEGNPADEKKPGEGGEAEPKTEKSAQDTKPEAKAEDGGVSKALKDTKAWGTKLAQENSELKKLVEDLKAGKTTQTQVDEAKDKIGETKRVIREKLNETYKDYPELKDSLDLMAGFMESLSGEVENFKKTSEEAKAFTAEREAFEREVAPEIVKVHPDFREIAASEEYVKWAEKQTPAMQVAALRSRDPRDINSALSEYKKFLGSDESKKQQLDEDKRREAVKKNLSSTRGGGSANDSKGKPSNLKDVEKDDYNGAWDLLASKEK